MIWRGDNVQNVSGNDQIDCFKLAHGASEEGQEPEGIKHLYCLHFITRAEALSCVAFELAGQSTHTLYFSTRPYI